MLVYNSTHGQSIYDICLNTYGSFDYLFKLLSDNGIESIDTDISLVNSWTWDENKVTDQRFNYLSSSTAKTYATHSSIVSYVGGLEREFESGDIYQFENGNTYIFEKSL